MNPIKPKRVIAAEPLDGFRMRIHFNDGVVREIDLQPYLRGPVFEPLLKSRSSFCSVEVEGGTISWESGADIDPNVLYYDELKPAELDLPGDLSRSA
jgi:hypothetical protein